MAVERLGGVKDAKPLLVWEELVPSFPEVTIQMVRWHLQRHRMKPKVGDELVEQEPMRQEQPNEGSLEADTDVQQQPQQQQQERQQQPQQEWQQQRQQQQQRQRRRPPQSQLGLAEERDERLRNALPFDHAVCLQVLLPVLEQKLGAVMRQKALICVVSDESSRMLDI